MASAISGLDLNAPLDQATRAMLRAALHDSLVLCIRDQHSSTGCLSRRHDDLWHARRAYAARAAS